MCCCTYSPAFVDDPVLRSSQNNSTGLNAIVWREGHGVLGTVSSRPRPKKAGKHASGGGKANKKGIHEVLAISLKTTTFLRSSTSFPSDFRFKNTENCVKYAPVFTFSSKNFPIAPHACLLDQSVRLAQPTTFRSPPREMYHIRARSRYVKSPLPPHHRQNVCGRPDKFRNLPPPKDGAARFQSFACLDKMKERRARAMSIVRG
ncbi:hypothetical protein DFH11DRAFT_103493 [Phellopilus nigrolimitatus]|nr:hypothetical protein DFH11DRAFT_103493 [Phellopilus nigrolimitatus]